MVREKEKPRSKYAYILYPLNARHGHFILSYISISSSVEFLSLKKIKEKAKHICTSDEIIGNSLILRSTEIFL